VSDKNYYISISELPIWNWWKIAETGNLIYLHKDNDYTKVDYSLVGLWNNLQNQYLDEFGITQEFEDVIKLKKKWIIKKADYLLTGERFKLTELDIIEAEINETMNSKITVDKDDTVIMLETKLNRELNPKKISVKKYYNYINYFSNQK
jgi:hypothetical protein